MKLEVTCRSQSIMKGIIEVTEEEYAELMECTEGRMDLAEAFINGAGEDTNCYVIISRVNKVLNVASFDDYIENIDFEVVE